MGTVGLRGPEAFSGDVPKLSRHRGSVAQELTMAMPLAQGHKDLRVWDVQTPEGPNVEARSTKGYRQSDVCSRPPHLISCTCRILQAFGSIGCSRSTNPMDLKAEHQLGDGGLQAGTALPPPARKAVALGDTGHCPETPGVSRTQATGGRQ